MNIVDYIPRGKEHAISRQKLAEITGLNDSAMRKEIAKARRDTCIINFQNGKGYYRPTDKAEVERYIRQEEHRAKSIFYNLQGAKNYLNQMENQMYFADVF